MNYKYYKDLLGHPSFNAKVEVLTKRPINTIIVFLPFICSYIDQDINFLTNLI